MRIWDLHKYDLKLTEEENLVKGLAKIRDEDLWENYPDEQGGLLGSPYECLGWLYERMKDLEDQNKQLQRGNLT